MYSKEQILQSKNYANRKDLLKVLLKDDEQYTLENVEELVNKFNRKKVK